MSLTQAAIAANRFGLGARPGELARIAADPRGALRAQLQGAVPQPAGTLAASHELLAQVLAQRAQRQGNRAPAPGTAPQGESVVAVARSLRDIYLPGYLSEVTARLGSGVSSERSFVERLVHFWSNHFAVSVDKLQVLGLAGPMEREAIRPHVLGRFTDMLRAVEQHPAMLLYLDNAQSAGPNSRLAQFAARRERQIGLNENLAREILELHTLGVEGGYGQKDVQGLAAIISGWSLGGVQGRAGLGALAGGEPGAFFFREGLHEPGTHTLLGRAYSQDGVQQGEAALQDLARHPSTARHLATKLARHFVADDPPAATVDRLARVFLDTGGDLPQVYRVLIDSPEAWQTQFTKFRTPNDYVYAAYRALQLPVAEGRAAASVFELLGQRNFQPGSPAGWPDRSADWDGSAALMKRLEWAQQLAQRVGSTRRADDLATAGWAAASDSATVRALGRAQDGSQAMVLALAAPEFMRR